MSQKSTAVLNQVIRDNFLAKNLKFLRNLRGISQQKLADQLGLKRNNIASYEAGIVEPRPEILLKLSKYFRISPEQLILDDLTTHSLDILPDNTRPVDPKLSELIETLIKKTDDLQQVVEGFKEFYKYRETKHPAQSLQAKSLQHDLQNLMTILGKLLDTNWEFIQDV